MKVVDKCTNGSRPGFLLPGAFRAGRLPRGGSLDGPDSGNMGEGLPMGASAGFASILGVFEVTCQYQRNTQQSHQERYYGVANRAACCFTYFKLGNFCVTKRCMLKNVVEWNHHLQKYCVYCFYYLLQTIVCGINFHRFT